MASRVHDVAKYHFYPRPPRGGRLVDLCFKVDDLHISIHALREEGDDGDERHTFPVQGFLSTPSARRATSFVQDIHPLKTISIHALREEGDPGVGSTKVTRV